MKRFRKIAAVGQALGLAAVALCVLLLVGIAFGPRTGRYRTMTVLTASMRPSMPEGSVIVQVPVDLRKVRAGDVITYRIPVEDRRVVTHRVVKVVKGGAQPVVRTKGDANRSADPWLARLEGKKVWLVKASVPKLGYALQALRRPEAKRVTLFLVPLLLTLLWLRDIWAPRPGQDPQPAYDEARPAAPGRAWQGLAALAALGAVVLLSQPKDRRA